MHCTIVVLYILAREIPVPTVGEDDANRRRLFMFFSCVSLGSIAELYYWPGHGGAEAMWFALTLLLIWGQVSVILRWGRICTYTRASLHTGKKSKSNLG